MILAVDIGGTQFSVALATERGQLKRVVRRPTDRAGGAAWMISQIVDTGTALAASARGKIRACGIGFGGPVDFDAQRVVQSTHVAGWRDAPLARVLSEAFGVPAVMDNDANVGALGEAVYGAGRGAAHVVYYTVSTGIGGGIVHEGEIYRGANGFAGELGHVPILLDGPPCDCGNRGCLEALCSGPSIARRARQALTRNRREARASRLNPDGLTARDVFAAARQSDPVAREVVGETAVLLSMGVAATINTLAPDVVVIGGGVSKAGNSLLVPLRRETRSRVMPVHRESVRILKARHGDRSVLLGAVALALRETASR